MGPEWYHCKRDRRKFNVRTGTIMERSHIPLSDWYAFLTQIGVGTQPYQVSKILGITYRSARKMVELTTRYYRGNPRELWWVKAT
jgi:hypothetical protein